MLNRAFWQTGKDETDCEIVNAYCFLIGRVECAYNAFAVWQFKFRRLGRTVIQFLVHLEAQLQYTVQFM